MYTDCVTAYLNYLTEESNKKYYQYLLLPKSFKFKNKYKDIYDKSYAELTNQNAKRLHKTTVYVAFLLCIF